MLAPPATVPAWVNWASPELERTTRAKGSSAASALQIRARTTAAGAKARRSSGGVFTAIERRTRSGPPDGRSEDSGVRACGPIMG